jgi:acyl-CoA thioesterase I
MMAEDMIWGDLIQVEKSGSSGASDTSVMIMAVSSRLMLLAVLTFALTACGGQVNNDREVAQTSQTAQAPQTQYPERQPAPVSDTRPTIIAFGDSISAGYGVAQGKTYPEVLQHLLDAAGYQYRVENLGVSGDTTTDGVERLPEVLGLHPAIVILEFGGNDGLRGLPVASARMNLAKMIEDLRATNIEILLAGMTLPRNYGPDYIKSFDQMYVDLAKEYKLARIPFLLDGVGGHPDLTQPDGIHPTADGDRIVASTVMQYLRPLLHK